MLVPKKQFAILKPGSGKRGEIIHLDDSISFHLQSSFYSHKFDQPCRWVDNIRMDLGVMWTGLGWLRIGTGGELL
jgi:hypothetical protein